MVWIFIVLSSNMTSHIMETFLKQTFAVLCLSKNPRIIRNIFISLSRKGKHTRWMEVGIGERGRVRKKGKDLDCKSKSWIIQGWVNLSVTSPRIFIQAKTDVISGALFYFSRVTKVNKSLCLDLNVMPYFYIHHGR